MKKGYGILMLLVFGLIIGTFYMAAGDLYIYIDLASFFITLPVAFMVSLMSSSFNEVIGFMKQARESEAFDENIIRNGISYFRHLQILLLLLGTAATLIGIVSMFVNYNAADIDSIGKGYSASIITIVYSLIFVLVIVQPYISALRKKLAGGDR